MAGPFDQLLVAPDPARLREVLAAAARPIDFRTRRLRLNHILDRWLASVEATPEGNDLFRRPTRGFLGERYCGLSWWSDHQGRRHVRVFGGDLADGGTHRHIPGSDDDPRSPLWHVYPERVFRVERPLGKWTTLVSCSCGATGEPAAVAWMGPCCGPCHDRREEGDPSMIDRPAVLETGRTVYGVAVSRDGAKVATGEANRQLVLRHLDNQPLRFLQEGDPEPSHGEIHNQFIALAFSPNDKLLAVADSPRRWVRLWPMVASAVPAKLHLTPEFYDSQILGLAFSPTGRFLAACTDSGCLTVWDRSNSWGTIYQEREGVTSFAFLPDRHTLALGGAQGAVRLLDTATWEPILQFALECTPDQEVFFLSGTGDGRALIILTGSQSPEHGTVEQLLRRWDLTRNCETHSAGFPPSSLFALSRNGRYAARTHHDMQHSPAAVHLWDLDRWQAAGSLEWDTEDAIYSLSFSPDGHTLAVGTQRGRVVLFPWRLLLEA